MITFILALAAAAQAAPLSDEATFASCQASVKANPEKGLAIANEWRVRGGGMYALQCLGLAYAETGRWAAAATSFEQAAEQAGSGQDPRRADFSVQAGNAWLAAGEPAKAVKAFDAALVTTALTPELRGEVHLDRARADVALEDLAGARVDIDKAAELVPNDPMVWYLSSALALRQKDLPRAQDDIAEALRLAPDNPDLLVHAGNVAGVSGEIEAAKGLYMKAIRLAPQSEAAKAARAALKANADEPAKP